MAEQDIRVRISQFNDKRHSKCKTARDVIATRASTSTNSLRCTGESGLASTDLSLWVASPTTGLRRPSEFSFAEDLAHSCAGILPKSKFS